jgi:hypothetical protein
MYHHIIRITLKGLFRMVLVHPFVKADVHEDIGKQRTYDASLWSASEPIDALTIFLYYTSFQPPFDVQ